MELRQLASTRKVLTEVRNAGSPAGGVYTFDEVMHIVGVFSPSTSRESVAKIIASHPFLDRTRNKPVPSYEPTPAYEPTPEHEENFSEDKEINCDDEFSTAIGNNRNTNNHHANHVEKTEEYNG